MKNKIFPEFDLPDMSQIFNTDSLQDMYPTPELYQRTRKYDEKKEKEKLVIFSLSNRQKEDIVVLIHSGKNSYKDICLKIPTINSPTLRQYLDGEEIFPDDASFDMGLKYPRAIEPTLFRFADGRTTFSTFYEFKDTDRFDLVTAGIDLYDQMIKDRVLYQAAEYAGKSYRISLILGIISICIPILIALLQKL